MKYTKLFPILLICPFLLAAAPSNSETSEPEPALYLDVNINLIEENIEENKRIFELVFTNNEAYPAFLERNLYIDGNNDGIFDFYKIIERTYAPFNGPILHSGHQESYTIETTLEYDYPTSNRIRTLFYTAEIAEEVSCKDVKVILKSDRENIYTLEGEFLNMDEDKYIYEAIIDVTYNDIPASFIYSFENDNFYYNRGEELDLNELEIKNITFYKKVKTNSGGGLISLAGEALALIALMAGVGFIIIVSLILGFIGMIIAAIIIACVIVNKKKKEN